MVNAFDTAVKDAEALREQGNPTQALKLFLDLQKQAITFNQKISILGHIGLCYEHSKLWQEALDQYELMQKLAVEQKNSHVEARALRHIASVCLAEKDQPKALEYAITAYWMVKDLPRPPADLVWYAHGVVKMLLSSPEIVWVTWKGIKIPSYIPKELLKEIRKWTLREVQDMGWSIQDKNPLAKAVWFTSLCADIHFAWFPWLFPLAVLGLAIAKFNNLQLQLNKAKK